MSKKLDPYKPQELKAPPRYRDFAEQVSKPVLAWRPRDTKEHPNPLIGRMVSAVMRESEYGLYPVLRIEDESGQLWSVHAFHTVLKNQLKETAPQVGEVVGVIYLGTQQARGSGGATYENYRFDVEREDAESGPVDWASLKTEDVQLVEPQQSEAPSWLKDVKDVTKDEGPWF